jgi:xanthine dehydrogenase accessory factor
LKNWKETTDLLSRVVRLAEARRKGALATLIRVEGSAYRRPGAKFLVEEDGGTLGSISGGCLEGDVREVALDVLRSGAPRLLEYETSGDDSSVFSLGLGCSGSVEIFVQIATSVEALEAAREILHRLSGGQSFSVSTIVRGNGAGRVSVFEPGGEGEAGRREPAEVFVETLQPPPHLLLFGAGDDAIPLCAYSADAGFRVSLVDHRSATLSPERFPAAFGLATRRPEETLAGLPAGPRAFAVVKTHNFAHDREWVRQLLSAGVPYVGLLGPRARGARILSEVGAVAGERVFTPVGLDLGAEGPEQVALSIVAELLAVHSSRQPWSLREKESAIHAG